VAYFFPIWGDHIILNVNKLAERISVPVNYLRNSFHTLLLKGKAIPLQALWVLGG